MAHTCSNCEGISPETCVFNSDKAPITIHHLREREIHMVGDAVGVCWNTKSEKRAIEGTDGQTYVANVPMRRGDPYIDFVTIRHREGLVWEDEDSPVDGGMAANYAEGIVQELQAAIAYLRSLS